MEGLQLACACERPLAVRSKPAAQSMQRAEPSLAAIYANQTLPGVTSQD